jgi:hypothetical protein
MHPKSSPGQCIDNVPLDNAQPSSSPALPEKITRGGCNGGDGEASPPCPTADGRETVRVVGTSAASAAKKNGGIPQSDKLRSVNKQIRIVVPGWLVKEMETLAPTRMGELLRLALMSRIQNPRGLPNLVKGAEQARRLGVLLAQTISYGNKDSDIAALVPEIEELVFAIKRLALPRSKHRKSKSPKSTKGSPDDGQPRRKTRWAGAAISLRVRLPVDLADDLLKMPPELRNRALWLVLSPGVSESFDLAELAESERGIRVAGRMLNDALRIAGRENNFRKLAPAAAWVIGYMKLFQNLETKGDEQ